MALRAFFDSSIARLWVDLSIAPHTANAVIISASETGFLIDVEAKLDIGAQIFVTFSEADVRPARLSWAGPGLLGCLFDSDIPSSLWDAGTTIAQPDEVPERGPIADRRLRDPSLGARLRRLRNQRGLRQDAVASALGVSSATISLWESDKAVPKPSRLAEIASFLGVPVEEISRFSQRSHDVPDSSVEILRSELAAKLGVPPTQLRILVELLRPGKLSEIEAVSPVLGL